MQRKPGFPVANCSIKMPDSAILSSEGMFEEDSEQQQRRLQLINFGHSQWGFNNWSWAVTKQDLDFVEQTNGKYTAGVVAFVSISVKSFEIHRENIGYATSTANNKGLAIYKSRKCAVTNALRETLLSFGGGVATDLLELPETTKRELSAPTPAPEPLQENNQNLANKMEIKNIKNTCARKDSEGSAHNMRSPHPGKVAAGAPAAPPVARAQPMPAALPPAPRPRPPAPPAAPAPAPAPPLHRPNSNVSFVVPMMGGMVPPLYGGGRAAPPQFPGYYEYAPSWHFAYDPYERHHGNVNLNFNVPPKSLVVNSRGGSLECKRGAEGEPLQYAAPQSQACWIKPTIFYDGFWTEQKVKKWVAEQVEKQFPDECGKVPSPAAAPDK